LSKLFWNSCYFIKIPRLNKLQPFRGTIKNVDPSSDDLATMEFHPFITSNIFSRFRKHGAAFFVVIQTRRDDIKTSEFVNFTVHNVFRVIRRNHTGVIIHHIKLPLVGCTTYKFTITHQ